jgi:hypothetical protein
MFLEDSLVFVGRHFLLHGLAAGLPFGGANLAVLVRMLESLDKAHGLIRVPADGQVTNCHVSKDSLLVDDVGGPGRAANVLEQAPVLGADRPAHVREKWALHLSQSARFPGLLAPLMVHERGVDRAAQHHRVEVSQFLGQGPEGDDLGRTHEGEVKGPEKQHHVLPTVVRKRHPLEFPVGHQGIHGKLGSGLVDFRYHYYRLYLYSFLSTFHH